MFVANTVDVRANFKKLCDMAEQGERILISRPKQRNLILISEEEFVRLCPDGKEKPQSKYEVLSRFFGIAKGDPLEKSDKELLLEELVEKYESIS